jgi:hypothetical protein
LAKVAATIAEQGGNIISVDVHRAGASAVDDLVVDFPEAADLPALRNELSVSGAATLLSHQAAHVNDPVVIALTRAGDMLDRPPGAATDELVAAVSELCASPVVWVSEPDDVDRYGAGRFARQRGEAIALRTDELPRPMAELLPGEVWLLAIPETEDPENGRVIFVARPLSNEFTSTEIVRIEALMALYRKIEQHRSF